MHKPSVILHPMLPPGTHDLIAGMDGIAVQRPADNDGVAEALAKGGEVLVSYTWRDSFLSPSLRWLASPSAGFDQFPVGALREAGVTTTTGAGVHADCVAEHAFALLLAMTRRVGLSARNMAAAEWVRGTGEELWGKKLAIIGIGRIGDAFARRCAGWGIEVVGVKRNPDTYAGPVETIRPTTELLDVCAWADILVLASPAQADGSALIGKPELEALGPGWIVNIGRGSLIDEAALAEVLEHGALRGAGLDVFAKEPLPADSPLWTSPKVIVTPHIGGGSPGFGPRFAKLFAENLQAFHGNGDWTNLLGRDIPTGV